MAPDVRIVLWEQQRKKRNNYDGMWWPRSRDLAAELPMLNSAMADQRGPLVHIMFNRAFWDAAPRGMRVDGQRMQLRGFYTLQPSLLIATDEDGRRVDLLVVPPETDPGPAGAMMQMSAPDAMAAAIDLEILPGMHG